MLYLFIAFLLICCVYIYDVHNYKSHKLTVFYCFFSLLIFLNVFSYEIGGDTANYVYYWKELYSPISSINLLSEFDSRTGEMPGWILITSLLKEISDDFMLLRLVQAIFVNLIVARFIRQNTAFIFASLLLYFVTIFFNYNFEILRESVAVSFFLLSYPYYNNKSWLKYLGCFLCAFMFHESALIMLIFPLFRLTDNIGSKKLLLLLFIFYVLFAMIDLVAVLTYIIPDNFSFYVKFISYMNSDTYGIDRVSNRFLSFLSSFLVPSMSFLLLRRYSDRKELCRIILIAIVLNALTSSVYIFYRFSNYILLPLSVAYVEAIYLLSKKFVSKNSPLFLFIPILFVYIIYKVYSVYAPGTPDEMGKYFYERYYPYTFIFDKGHSEW